jgi:pantoate--beta-alanine ligase
MREHADKLRREGKTLVLVPTMGYFHNGHISLIRKGRSSGDELIVSVFVNPSQFGPEDDYEKYPRDLHRDLDLAEKEKVDCIFAPERKEIYSETFQTYVSLEKLPNHLCGLSRPSHFRGVATVISKLFNIVRPHIAIFGQKDYQQLLIIRRMVMDLNFNIKIVDVPTVRERDGLAMSSRNTYLTPQQRNSARSLYQSLKIAQELVKGETRDADKIISVTKKSILKYPETLIDYITICDPDTLERVETIDGPTLMALAVHVGETRLIDNMILKP